MKRVLTTGLLILLPTLAQADYKGELSQDKAWEKISAHRITVLDVRSPEEFASGHVPGAINIPHDEIANRLSEIPTGKDQSILLYCRSGRRAGQAEEILTGAGYSDLYHLQGDMLGWADNNRPIEK